MCVPLTMAEMLALIAAAPGVRDPLHINVWTEDACGMPQSEPGRQARILYRRGDGAKRLRAQTGEAWPRGKR